MASAAAVTQDVFIFSAVRTPIASFRGSFASLSSVDLGTIVVKETIKRAEVSPEEIEETIVGAVLTAGVGQNVARQIAIASGIPESSHSFTVNKVCSSGMKAVILGTQAIQLGYRNLIVAAGTESMSNAPFYMPRGEIPYGGLNLVDGIQKDGLTDAMLNNAMGLCAEKSVKDYGIDRKAQDQYALESYRRAAEAWKNGLFTAEVIPVCVCPKPGTKVTVAEDEEYKRLIEEKVSTLRPAFLKGDSNGTITAANASSINDGAAALVIGSAKFAGKRKPLAKILAYAEVGRAPVDFTVAPALAIPKLLEVAKLRKEDIALWEVNEAFAITAIAFVRDLGLDANRVNVRGGAVALGHPIGMSGARIIVTLVHALSPGQLGIAAICNGGGEATAILIEKM